MIENKEGEFWLLEDVVRRLNERSKKHYGIRHAANSYLLVEFLNGKDDKAGVHSIAWGKTQEELFLNIRSIIEYLDNEKEERTKGKGNKVK
jgi:hypothetical protein